MATAAWPEDDFVCSVCLESLHDPATLPCGHTYCLPCIQAHWDRDEATGQFSCPQCRQVFTPRPSLARSTVLVEAMEKLRRKGIRESPYLSVSSGPTSVPVHPEVYTDTAPRLLWMYPKLPAVGPVLCPRHQQPLELYCQDEKESVCEECCRHGHKDHRVVKLEEERTDRQRELVLMQAETRQRIQEGEKELQVFPKDAQIQKSQIQALQKEVIELFSELVKSVELMGCQVGELLSNHDASMGCRGENHLHRLEQELAQLRSKDLELSRLAGMQDHVVFLKSILTLEPLTSHREVRWGEETLVSEVQTVMGELKDGVQDLFKNSLARMFRTVNKVTSENSPSHPEPPLPPTQPPLPPNQTQLPPTQAPLPPTQVNQVTTVGLGNPEPKTREEMLKFHCEPTFDPNTAYRHLKLTNGDRKATLKAENQNYPQHPERFVYWRQILCREPLSGSPYYWEIEWTGQKITIGVAYRDLDRKEAVDSSRLGYNEQSWSLNWSGTGFSVWHAGKETRIGSAKARRLGVYLDQHEGVLAFYRVLHNQADLIHSLQTNFTAPLYPSFRFGSGFGASVTLCQLD
ncbi:finTRIM family, member 86 isoform X2 [Esox lucius]|uniref:Tripartite motif-containing protein 16-like n=2 Tax=Esox lucius TaxID=8010 RepID=A0A3P8ZSA5_ESOLU|nr:finTRIM family, member 86 isoform X2 [Esox lucius]